MYVYQIWHKLDSLEGRLHRRPKKHVLGATLTDISAPVYERGRQPQGVITWAC